MVESKVDIVRRAYVALVARDVDAMLALTDPKVQLFAPRTGAETGQPYHFYMGHDGVRQYLNQVAQVWDELVFSPNEYRERDEYVVAIGTLMSRPRGGRTSELDGAWGWRVHGDTITWARAYLEPSEALRDVPMPKIEIVAKAIDASRKRDLQTVLSLWSPKVEFEAPVTGAASGEAKVYRGHDGLAECFADLAEVWEEIDIEVEHFREVGDQVVAFGRLRGQTKDGREVDTPAQWVWRLEAEQLVWTCEYTDVDAALRAAGLLTA